MTRTSPEPLAPEPWPFGPHSRRLRCGEISWHVQLQGDGPAFLLLHGTGASSHTFEGLARSLAQRFTLVAPDLPGHALSETPRGFRPSLPAIAHALSVLLHELGVAPVAVVGHSAGAALALHMVLHQAIEPRLIVGIAAALIPPSRIAKVVLSRAARVLGHASKLVAWTVSDSEHVDRILRSTGASLDARGIEFYRLLSARPHHVAGTLSMMAHWDLAPLYRELPSLSVPLLLLAGELDRAVPVPQLRTVLARAPAARMRVIEATGHLLHEEQPSVIASLIVDEFIRVTARQPESSS